MTKNIIVAYCTTPELNTDALICLAVQWEGWVCACAGTMGCVGLGL